MKTRHLLRLNNRAFLALLIVFAGTAFALTPAEWRYRQTVEVPAAGLMRIELQAATIHAARTELQDLRLLDATGIEVPFLIEEPMPLPAARQRTKWFNVTLDPKATTIAIETGTAKAVSGVTLESPARDFIKAARIEGSLDGLEWKELRAGMTIFHLPSGAENLAITFPNGVWKFLRVTIDDQRAGPVPFTGAQTHGEEIAAPAEPVAATIKSRDEGPGATRLVLDLGAANLRLAGIELETPEPLFSRGVTVAVPQVVDEVIQEQPLATGTVHRVKFDDATAANLKVRLEKQVRSRELIVTVSNQDSPPLSITAVRAERRVSRLVFFAREPGALRLLSGHSQCAAPRYDVAALAARLAGASAVSITPGPLLENPDYRAPEVLAGLGEASAPLDIAKWKFRKPVQISAAGVQQLELDLDVLSRAGGDFSDLRLMRSQRQHPYLVERTSLTREITAQFTLSNDPKKPRLSRWTIEFPQRGLPLTRIGFHSPALLLEREVRVWEEVPDERGDKVPQEIGRASWRRTPGEAPRELGVHVSRRPVTDTLFVETDNGDNPPIELASVRAWYPATRLAFKTADVGDTLHLYYGNPEAARPRYDLALVAPQLLAAEKCTATLGLEEGGKKSAWFEPEPFSSSSRIAFWSVLAAVVAALLFVLARLLPKSTPPA